MDNQAKAESIASLLTPQVRQMLDAANSEGMDMQGVDGVDGKPVTFREAGSDVKP